MTMGEVPAYYQGIIDEEAMLLLSGLVIVFAYQVAMFRQAERSSLFTATYFVTTVAFVAGPFLAAVIATPNRSFTLHDREVIWMLLSYLISITGIACSGSPQRGEKQTASSS
jgi:hypothetical protein